MKDLIATVRAALAAATSPGWPKDRDADSFLRASSPSWLADLCNRLERAEADAAAEDAAMDEMLREGEAARIALIARAEAAEKARDLWARQCNLISEAQANGMNLIEAWKARAEAAEARVRVLEERVRVLQEREQSAEDAYDEGTTEERAVIVAWLREHRQHTDDLDPDQYGEMFADAIESGAHTPKEDS